MPAPTGELTLDIRNYEEGMANAIKEMEDLAEAMKLTGSEITKLEKELNRLRNSTKLGEGKKGSVTQGVAKQLKDAQIGLKEQKRLYKETQVDVRTYGSALAGVNVPARTLMGSLSKLRSAVGLLFSGMAFGAILAFGKSLLNFGKEIQEASRVAGVLPEKLQRIQAAFAGKMSADDSTSALTRLNQAMKAAREGSAEAESKLNQLGLTFEDIATKTPDEAMLILADHVKAATDPVEALRQVTNLFGEELGAKLIPVLEQGGIALKDMGDAATVASDSTVEMAAAGARALERLGTAAKQTALKVIGAWAGIIDFMRGKGEFDLSEQEAAIRKLEDQIIARSGQVTHTPANLPPEKQQESQTPTRKVSPVVTPTKKATPAGTKTELVSQAAAERELLKIESEIALKIAPAYVKEKEKLVAQSTRLQSKLAAVRDIDRDRVRLEIAQNTEAQRALFFAEELRKSSIAVNTAKASKGRGFEEEQRIALEEIRDIDAQIAVAGQQHDKEKIASLQAQRRQMTIANKEREEAHGDELAQLSYQTTEMEAQFKGLTGLAAQVSIIAKYDSEITRQLRLQNGEAVKLLEKQKEIALIQARAVEHDITPRQRVEARRTERITRRKSRQQEGRENALRAAAGRGARGVRITEQLEKDKAAMSARNREINAADSAKMQQAAIKAVIDIAHEVIGGK